MRLSDKYVKESERAGSPEKKAISDDSFAICEFLEKLTDKIEHARISLR